MYVGGRKMMEKVSTQNIYPTSSTSTISREQREMKPLPTQQKAVKMDDVTVHLNEKQKGDVQEVVEGLNKFLKPSLSSLKFEFHEGLNEYYITIIDEETKEVIKEIPPKKLLDLYQAMAEYVGLMVDKKI